MTETVFSIAYIVLMFATLIGIRTVLRWRIATKRAVVSRATEEFDKALEILCAAFWPVTWVFAVAASTILVLRFVLWNLADLYANHIVTRFVKVKGND